jgi:uncharacterized delta-60 repeat protein
VAFLLGLLTPPSPAFGAGELDPTFGGDGKVVTDFFRADRSRVDRAFDVAVQADGKIVAVGVSSRGNFAIDFAIVRYNLDGSLDSTFGGGDGQVLTDLGGDDSASAVAIQADGKIVVAGTSTAGGNPFNFALVRYKTGGGLDPTFDGDGKVLTDFLGSDTLLDVAIQTDGKIVAAGVTGLSGDFALARYNSNGSLDASFDGDGRVVTDFGDDDGARAVAIQADGKIVAGGSTFAGTGADPIDFALARYNPDGSLDPSFSDDGKVVTDFGAQDAAADIAIQADGRIVAAGFRAPRDPVPQPGDFAIARYNLDGTLDSSFDGDGRVVTDVAADDTSLGLAIQPDGKIVAAGMSRINGSSPFDFALARYNPGGTLDRTFTGDGKVLTDFDADDQAQAVAIQPDGKIVAAGFSFDDFDTNFALARYLPTGAQISINDVTAFEGNAGLTSFIFTVSLSSPSTETITVSRQTADGSASAPSDYTALGPATFTFSPGQTTKTAIVKVKSDLAIELNETFLVNLSNPTNATIADGQGKGTILNDDLSDAAPCTITGTPGNDVLNGTAGKDVICGGNGDDQLFGFDGADVLKGEKGDDLLIGGNGFDLLVGDAGVDDLRGENGNDTLRGGDRGDTLHAGPGSDALFGDAGADSLNTQDGVSANDSADGGSDSDSCDFDSGDFVTNCP